MGRMKSVHCTHLLKGQGHRIPSTCPLNWQWGPTLAAVDMSCMPLVGRSELIPVYSLRSFWVCMCGPVQNTTDNLLMSCYLLCHSDILRPFRIRPGTGSTQSWSLTWRMGSTCVRFANLCAILSSLSSRWNHWHLTSKPSIFFMPICSRVSVVQNVEKFICSLIVVKMQR